MMKKAAVLAIRLYQLTLASIFGGQCRFFPSCSDYTRQAIEKHGIWKGIGLGVKRLLKCHPFHSGGIDHVP